MIYKYKNLFLILAIVTVALLLAKLLNHGNYSADRYKEDVSVSLSGILRNDPDLHKILELNKNFNSMTVERGRYFMDHIDPALQLLSIEQLSKLLSELNYSNKDHRFLMFRSYHALALKDQSLALTMLVSLPEDPCKAIGSDIYEPAAKSNPKEVSEWILNSPWDDKNSRWVSIWSAGALAKHSPTEALTLLEKGDSERVARLAFPILKEIAKTNFSLALDATSFLPEGSQRDDLVVAIFHSLGGVDPHKAFLLLSDFNQPGISSRALPSIFSNWLESDVKNAASALATASPKLIQNILSEPENLTRVIEQDPALAIQAIGRLVFTKSNSGVFMQTVRELTEKNPEMVRAWLESFPESPKKSQLIKESAIVRVGKDAEKAMQEFLMEEPSFRKNSMEGAGIALGRLDPQKAFEYLSMMDSSDSRIFGAFVLKGVVEKNPGLAAEFIQSEKLGKGVREVEAYNEAVHRTAEVLASRDVLKAADWAMSLSGVDAHTAISGVAAQWAKTDPASLGNWIKSLPNGDAKNQAIEILAKAIEQTDPEAAQLWRDSRG